MIEITPPFPTHQTAVLNTTFAIENLIADGEIFFAPLEVYLDDESIPQPDVILLLRDSRCIVGAKRLEGPPDLIVEVLSPSTLKYDKDVKFKLYERFGVREYWIADPERLNVEVWTWVEGHYSPVGTFLANETFNSPVLGSQSVQVAAIFSTQEG